MLIELSQRPRSLKAFWLKGDASVGTDASVPTVPFLANLGCCKLRDHGYKIRNTEETARQPRQEKSTFETPGAGTLSGKEGVTVRYRAEQVGSLLRPPELLQESPCTLF